MGKIRQKRLSKEEKVIVELFKEVLRIVQDSEKEEKEV